MTVDMELGDAMRKDTKPDYATRMTQGLVIDAMRADAGSGEEN
jgi:hypothetical protein